MKKLVVFIFGLVFCFYAFAQENVELTVYNQNFALVKDQRNLDLKKGINKIEFKDVASLIEPTSVHFVSLTSPSSCSILEQNYEFDLMNSDKLLSKYIDKGIKIVTKDGKTYEGVLSSYDANNIVISSVQQGLSMIVRPDNIAQVSFDKIPEGLITKPTLVWELESEKEGKQLAEVSYLTGGVNWDCEYVTVLDKDDKNLSLDGWVSINNLSGVTYKNAKLKLIAGDVRRVQKELHEAMAYDRMEKTKAAAPQFQEKAFFEYHMYTLGRKATLKNNQTKQIALLSGNSVPVKKLFIYDPVDYYGWNWHYYDNDNSRKEQKIKVKIEFKNSKENNLGMPLPKGKIKVYKKDDDGTLQFIGEDRIDHTPKDETLRLYLGDAFDVVGERKKINYREGDHWSEESFEITLRNHKDSDIEVNVVEHMWRYSNWKVTNKSADFTKKDAQTIEFKVPVAKNGEVKVNYTVRYWW